MKTTTRINSSNIHLVERGDRLRFRAGEDHRDDWDGPRDFEVTVRRTILDSRHGPRVIADQRIEDGLDGTDDFYLADDWIINLIADGPRASLSPGTSLYGYCNGYFGRDSYGEKTVVAAGEHNGELWIVAQEQREPWIDGPNQNQLLFATGFPEAFLADWTTETDHDAEIGGTA